jgi:hypothetical protein
MRVVSKVALKGLRQRERIERLAQQAPAGVRVVPQEKYRAVLKHPRAGGFPAEGGKEWPNDRFTRRRIADGSITKETEQMRAEAKKKPDHYKPPPQGKDSTDSNAA